MKNVTIKPLILKTAVVFFTLIEVALICLVAEVGLFLLVSLFIEDFARPDTSPLGYFLLGLSTMSHYHKSNKRISKYTRNLFGHKKLEVVQ